MGEIAVVFHQVVIERPFQHGLPPGGGVHRPVDEHAGIPDSEIATPDEKRLLKERYGVEI